MPLTFALQSRHAASVQQADLDPTPVVWGFLSLILRSLRPLLPLWLPLRCFSLLGRCRRFSGARLGAYAPSSRDIGPLLRQQSRSVRALIRSHGQQLETGKRGEAAPSRGFGCCLMVSAVAGLTTVTGTVFGNLALRLSALLLFVGSQSACA